MINMAWKAKLADAKGPCSSCVMAGVYRALAYSQGCAVVFHSARGCAQIASTMDVNSQFLLVGEGRQEASDAVPLLSSNLREKDCIFGGADRLRGALRYSAETYHPECIAVAVSCTAGLIGDDAEAVCAEAEEELGVPILISPAAGFLGGTYTDGYRVMMEQIMNRFFHPRKHVPGQVLLLGGQRGPGGQYAAEIQKILFWFGLEARWQFPSYVPVREWADIPSASLGIVLGGGGTMTDMLQHMAGRLEADFGIPFLPPVYPVGWEGTCRFIRTLAAFLGREAEGEALVEKETGRLAAAVKPLLPVTKGKRVVIVVGRRPFRYDPTDTVGTVERLQMHLTAVVLDESLSEGEGGLIRADLRGCCDAPVLSAAEGRPLMEEADILLTTVERSDMDVKQLRIPLVTRVGVSGEVRMHRGIYHLLCRYGNKGGMAWV